MNVVLVNPEIPQNTGCVARLCAATGSGLYLVGEIHFSLDDRELKRAGLDYWQGVCLGVHRDWDSFVSSVPSSSTIHLFSKRATRMYTEAIYDKDDYLVFGSESKGLPAEITSRYLGSLLRLPILPGVRSLNLSGAVHAALFHGLSTIGFHGII